MMRSIVLVLALASLVVGTACAADRGFYFGISGGQAKYDFQPVPTSSPFISSCPNAPVGWNYCNLFIPPGQPRLTIIDGVPVFLGAIHEPPEVFWIPGTDDKGTSWNVLAGYRFSPYIAVEAAYNDFGTLHEFSPSRNIGPLSRTLEAEAEMETMGASLTLLGSLPITDQWNVYLRAGGLFADQDVARRLGTSRYKDSYDSKVLLYGIGTELDFGTHWTVRLDFQRYNDVGKGNGVGEADVDALTLGVLFRL